MGHSGAWETGGLRQCESRVQGESRLPSDLSPQSPVHDADVSLKPHVSFHRGCGLEACVCLVKTQTHIDFGSSERSEPFPFFWTSCGSTAPLDRQLSS